MAAGTLPEPGSQLGPCVEACEHRDCAATRRMAAWVCRLCGGTVGYDVRFYNDPDVPGSWVHASCLEERDEARQQLKGCTGHHVTES